MTNEEQAVALLERAQLLMEVRRGQEALRLARRARVADPENARACCVDAWALLTLERWEEARASAEAAIRLQPEEEWGHRLRAIALRRAGDREQALRSAEWAAALEPHRMEALQTLWSCHWDLGNITAARITAARLQESAPESHWSYDALGQMALGEGKHQEAEQHFRRALRLYPNSAAVLHDLGVCLENQGRSEEAIECFHGAMRVDPTCDAAGQGLCRTVPLYNHAGLALTIAVLIAMVLSIPWLINPGNSFLIGPTIFIVGSTCAVLTMRRKPAVLDRIAAEVVLFVEEENRRAVRREITSSLPMVAPCALFCATLFAIGCAGDLVQPRVCPPGTARWWGEFAAAIGALCVAVWAARVWRRVAGRE